MYWFKFAWRQFLWERECPARYHVVDSCAIIILCSALCVLRLWCSVVCAYPYECVGVVWNPRIHREMGEVFEINTIARCAFGLIHYSPTALRCFYFSRSNILCVHHFSNLMALRERERRKKTWKLTRTHTHSAHEWAPISKLMLMCDWCAAGVSLSVVCVCACAWRKRKSLMLLMDAIFYALCTHHTQQRQSKPKRTKNNKTVHTRNKTKPSENQKKKKNSNKNSERRGESARIELNFLHISGVFMETHL